MCLSCCYHTREEIPGNWGCPAVIGCIQAVDVIKYIWGIDKLLTNRFIIYDGLSLKFTELKVRKDPNCGQCGHLGGKE